MKFTLTIIAFIFFYSCNNSSGAKDKLETEKPTAQAIDLDQQLDSLYHTGVFNGFSVAVVDSSGFLYNRGYGFADMDTQKKYTEHTIINIASISKVFIGIALLKAEELNLIKLDDPINKHLPFKVINPTYPNDHITIRQLATHTSSIIDTDIYMNTCYINKDDVSISDDLNRYDLYYQNPSEKWIPLAQYLNNLLEVGQEFYNESSFSKNKPGEIREYSNIGAALCALVVESASKQSFDEFTEEHIFIPLEMTSTSWLFEKVDKANYSKLYFDNHVLPYYTILSYPDGALITSSTDLGKFLVELINGHANNGNILSPESYNSLFKSQLSESALDGKQNFNVGLFIDKELAYNVIGHTGGDPGTNTMMYFDTEKGIGKIFITNTDSEKENSKEVMWGIWDALNIYNATEK